MRAMLLAIGPGRGNKGAPSGQCVKLASAKHSLSILPVSHAPARQFKNPLPSIASQSNHAPSLYMDSINLQHPQCARQSLSVCSSAIRLYHPSSPGACRRHDTAQVAISPFEASNERREDSLVFNVGPNRRRRLCFL